MHMWTAPDEIERDGREKRPEIQVRQRDSARPVERSIGGGRKRVKSGGFAPVAGRQAQGSPPWRGGETCPGNSVAPGLLNCRAFFPGGGTFYRRAAAICSVGGVNRHLWISASRIARVVRGMVNRMARRVAGIYDSSPNAPAKALYCVGLDCWNEGVFPSTAMAIGMEIRDRLIAV